MIEVLVWLLISTQDGGYGGSGVTNVAMFKSLNQCQHVLSQLPNRPNAKCIQANILVAK